MTLSDTQYKSNREMPAYTNKIRCVNRKPAPRKPRQCYLIPNCQSRLGRNAMYGKASALSSSLAQFECVAGGKKLCHCWADILTELRDNLVSGRTTRAISFRHAHECGISQHQMLLMTRSDANRLADSSDFVTSSTKLGCW